MGWGQSKSQRLSSPMQGYHSPVSVSARDSGQNLGVPQGGRQFLVSFEIFSISNAWGS